MELPENFRRTVIGTYENGAAWLEQLPALIERIARRWSLAVGPAFANLSYNYVAPGITSDGVEVVLKLGPPNPELSSEMEALRIYDGRGAGRLLQCDPDAGALLEERLRPGVMLSTLEDDSEATLIAADVMSQLWRPLPIDPCFVFRGSCFVGCDSRITDHGSRTTNHKFPSLARWFRSLTELRTNFEGGTGPLPVRVVEEAESLFTDLDASQRDPVLLHGDLHHFNVLNSERCPWLAIDPKGIYGERAFDTAQFLLNPWPDLLRRAHPDRIIAQRIDLFAETLSLERERIRGWAFSNAVLSACWGVEDGEDMAGRYDLACAELLSALKI